MDEAVNWPEQLGLTMSNLAQAATMIAKSMKEVSGKVSELQDNLAVIHPAGQIQFLVYKLPGMTERVHYPCSCSEPSCPVSGPISNIVMHLNDLHEWTRGRIADWLDTIHDPTGVHGPNLNFKVEA